MHPRKHAVEHWPGFIAAVITCSAFICTPTPRTYSMALMRQKDNGAQDQGKVRSCRGAGMWFPASPGELRRTVDGFLAVDTPAIPEPPIALIVPHAGYTYSGPVAGKAYATLKGHPIKRVILLGVSHRARLRGASVLRVDAYETPLGRIPADPNVRDALLACSMVTEQPAAHEREHSVENQLPMLQCVLEDFQMVEVLVGDMTGEQRSQLAEVLRGLMDSETLIVVSTDFTHYGADFMYVPFRERVEDNLRLLNEMAIREILQVDVPGWDACLDETQDTICGRDAVGLLLQVLQPWDDARGMRVAYDTSGRMTGDWNTSVTYASVVFWREKGDLSQVEREVLLRLARDTVTAYLANRRLPEVDEEAYELTPRLRAPGAAFVTLRNQQQLRGCIGHVVAVTPLYQSVVENAYQACLDPRFTNNPVTSQEAPELSIEISVLTPLRRLLEPEKVQVGRDGLMMIRGRAQGLLLPQVPVEQGWSRDEFLAQTCLKAGLPLDAWRDTQTEIYRFSAQVFSEEETPPPSTGER